MKKEVSLLVIIHDGKLALQALMHQGQEILSVPGCSNGKVAERASELWGGHFTGTLQKFGRAVDVIIRPDGEVELTMSIYRVEISDVAKIHLPEQFSWYSPEQISSDPRCRRDRRFYLRLLENKPVNLEYSEEQLGDWIDAKILYWREAS